MCKRPGTEMVCRHKDYPSCGKRFHVGCLDPAPPPELVGGDWLCPDCEEDACADCGGAGELLLCDDCPLAWHLHCLMPPLEAVRRRPPPPPRRRARRPVPASTAPRFARHPALAAPGAERQVVVPGVLRHRRAIRAARRTLQAARALATRWRRVVEGAAP